MGKKLSPPSMKISKQVDKKNQQQLNSLIRILRPKVYITDSSDFKRLVQELTGNGNTDPIIPLSSSAAAAPPPPMIIPSQQPLLVVVDDDDEQVIPSIEILDHHQETSPDLSIINGLLPDTAFSLSASQHDNNSSNTSSSPPPSSSSSFANSSEELFTPSEPLNNVLLESCCQNLDMGGEFPMILPPYSDLELSELMMMDPFISFPAATTSYEDDDYYYYGSGNNVPKQQLIHQQQEVCFYDYDLSSLL